VELHILDKGGSRLEKTPWAVVYEWSADNICPESHSIYESMIGTATERNGLVIII
jgi:hypothetical protein